MENARKIPQRVTMTIVILLPLFLLACNASVSPEIQTKINPVLFHLYEAEKEGNAQEYAHQNNIGLIEGNKVRVYIRFQPKDKNKVFRSVKRLGEAEIILEDEIRVLVPVNKLVALAQISSVIFVTLPKKLVPG